MLTRDTLPIIPDDCYWNVEHNGTRRAQPVRVEVRRARAVDITDYAAGRRSTIPVSSIVAWDYSSGTESDVREVAERLAKTARELRRVAVGIIA